MVNDEWRLKSWRTWANEARELSGQLTLREHEVADLRQQLAEEQHRADDAGSERDELKLINESLSKHGQELEKQRDEARAHVTRLLSEDSSTVRSLSEQLAASVEVLDNLSAVAHGDPPSHEWPVATMPERPEKIEQAAMDIIANADSCDGYYCVKTSRIERLRFALEEK